MSDVNIMKTLGYCPRCDAQDGELCRDRHGGTSAPSAIRGVLIHNERIELQEQTEYKNNRLTNDECIRILVAFLDWEDEEEGGAQQAPTHSSATINARRELLLKVTRRLRDLV
jgi:hypothetical protein